MKTMFDLRDHSTIDLSILESVLGIALRDVTPGDNYTKQTLMGYRMISQQAYIIAAQREQEAGYKDIILELDGNECSLAEFIEANDLLPADDLAKIKSLKLGETYSINLGAGGVTEIKRIK